MAGKNHQSGVLRYVIHKYSSSSPKFSPDNILIDNPTDSSSRWSTDSIDPPQFITLKLLRPAIVKTITFGKYQKLHGGNLRKFLVVGGMEDRNMCDILSGSLKNDNIPESFSLWNNSGFLSPVQYISIILQRAWSPELSFSIWHIKMEGDDEPKVVQNALFTMSLHQEAEAVRLCLKHLRARRYLESFTALQRETGVSLMSAQLENLWDVLVEKGDYQEAEMLVENAIKDGLIDWFLERQSYTPCWCSILPCSGQVAEKLSSDASESPSSPLPAADNLVAIVVPEGAPPDRDWPDSGCTINELQPSYDGSQYMEDLPTRPGARGGHQLCCDSARGTLYLFGGWDGDSDLDDLWTYSIAADKWTLICRHSEVVGGPTPRSCHKMVLDPIRRQIFTLGRYLDSPNRIAENLKSDLYAFDIISGTWRCVCPDTWLVGGPRLVFDHQMCIDTQTNTIYIFGGRVLPNKDDDSSTPLQYSGLYAYHIPTDTWRLLLADAGAPHPSMDSLHGLHQSSQPTLLARVGHSMLFHPIHRKLYIFAGQRNKEHLMDFIWYNVDTGAVQGLGAEEGLSGTTKGGRMQPPAAGSTQRATLDPDKNEIYVLSGVSKERDRRVCNALWVFSLSKQTWHCVYRNDRKQHTLDPLDRLEPCPRFAHQLVYDCVNKVHYLFGGNPGQAGQQKLRLDDFWALRLNRMTRDVVWRQLRALLRRARYAEMARGARTAPQAAAALRYLRESVHAAVEHNDEQQSARYRRLAARAFGAPPDPADDEEEFPHSKRVGISLKPGLMKHVRFIASPPHPAPAATLPLVLGEESPDSPESPSANTPEPFFQWSWENLNEMDHDTHMEVEGEEIQREAETRERRILIFDKLASHYPPHTAPPRKHLTDYTSV